MKSKIRIFQIFLQPRANEAGGMYGRGVLVRKYQTDQEIKVGYESIFKIISVHALIIDIKYD